ncbi:TorF family putative porin [Aliiglaciecola litoralis]|uniref:TorF family putative porin n=1 Tax=Aliiglaciecola litoralis TaxID=582857 RepID=A0ABN1LQI2_9ALTE
MKSMKLAALAVAVLSASSFSSTALAGVEANIGVTSNYLWRGVSQSSDDVSVSGGIDYSHDSGFYAGTWIGSIDFGSGAGTENDYYLGFGGESGDFGYDLGYIYYAFPTDGFEDSNFGEVYFNGTYKAFGFGVAYTVNSQVAEGSIFDTGDLYYSVSYGFDLPEEFSLGLSYGYYDFDAGSDSDYGHFQLDLAKGDFTFTISKADEEAAGAGKGDDTKFVVSWGTSF